MTTLEFLQAKIHKLKAQAEALAAKKSSAVIEKIRGLMAEHGLTTAGIDARVGGKKRGSKPGAKSAVVANASAGLLSFAAITDESPPKLAAASHGRCTIPIEPEDIDAWLNPDSDDPAALYAILDGMDRPYFQHRLAA